MKKVLGSVIALLLSTALVNAQPSASGNVTSAIVPNSVGPFVIKPAGGFLDGVDLHNFTTAGVFMKIYDAPTVTCGSGTPKLRFLNDASAGAGQATPTIIHLITPVLFLNGITVCMTTGIADNDTTAPAANVYIYNVYWR